MALSCLISTSQGYPLSRATVPILPATGTSTSLRWRNVSRLVAFMVEVFRGNTTLHFGLGAATTCCTTVQPLVSADHFMVSLVHGAAAAAAAAAPHGDGDGDVDDDGTEPPLEATFVAVLAAYVGATVRALFGEDIGRCSVRLGAAAEEQLSKSTFHDTVRAGGGGGGGDGDGDDDGGEDGGEDMDPFVAEAVATAAPPLRDALAVFQEHFLEPLLLRAAADPTAGFQPRWFDAVFRYHQSRCGDGAAAQSCCMCALHVASPHRADLPLLFSFVSGSMSRSRSIGDGRACTTSATAHGPAPPWWEPAVAGFVHDDDLCGRRVPPGGRRVGVWTRTGMERTWGTRTCVLVVSALGLAAGDTTLVAVGAFSPETVTQPDAAGAHDAAGWAPLPMDALEPRFWQAWGAAETRLVAAFFGDAAGPVDVDAARCDAALRATVAADDDDTTATVGGDGPTEVGASGSNGTAPVPAQDEPPPLAAPAPAAGGSSSGGSGGSGPSFSASARPGRTLRPADARP